MASDIDEAVNVEAAPMKRRRRRSFDIYDIRALVRTLIIVGLGAVIIYGCVLGDIWLWRLLYG